MYVPFDEIPAESRVWIYQSNRKFSETERDDIARRTQAFLEQWSAHGAPLHASFELPYDRFIVIGLHAETQPATGCSIDASVHFIQQLEADYNIELLDKMNVTFKNGEFLAHKTLAEFKKMAKERAVTGQTIVFNNLVNTVEEYRSVWEVPAEESWHSRFF